MMHGDRQWSDIDADAIGGTCRWGTVEMPVPENPPMCVWVGVGSGRCVGLSKRKEREMLLLLLLLLFEKDESIDELWMDGGVQGGWL